MTTFFRIVILAAVLFLTFAKNGQAESLKAKILERDGASWRAEVGGLNILYLHGDRSSMAQSHGWLMRNKIPDSAIPWAANWIDRLIQQALGHRPIYAALAKNKMRNDTQRFLNAAFRDYPDRSRQVSQEIEGLVRGSGYPESAVLAAALNPSIANMLANTKVAAAQASCTTVAAWGEQTPDGNLVIGRNTDYPLSRYFEDNTVAIYFDPTDSPMRYLVLTTAGAHTAGVLAINEAGLFLATHSLPSKFTGLSGMPFIMWMNDVIANARTIDEAAKILASRKTGVGWTYVLADAKERRVVSVERDNAGFGIRSSRDGYHVQTNHFLTPEMRSHNLDSFYGAYLDSHSRFDRAEKILLAKRGAFDQVAAMEILGDYIDPTINKPNGFPNSIAATTTVASVVYEPARARLAVAVGKAPVSQYQYISLPTPDVFDPDSFLHLNLPFQENNAFEREQENHFKALRHYIIAKEEFEYRAKIPEAIDHLNQAIILAPEIAAYRLVRGLLELRGGNFQAASFDLLNAEKGALDLHHRNISRYYLARLHLHYRDQAAARTLLQSIVSNFRDPDLGKTARDYLQKMQNPRFVPSLAWYEINPLMQFGTVVSY